jgi:hypothetical protein
MVKKNSLLFLCILFLFASCSKTDTNTARQKNTDTALENKKETELISYESFCAEYYERMDNVLASRKAKLIDYLEINREKAREGARDKILNTFFRAKEEYNKLLKEGSVPADIKQQIAELDELIQQHYIENYLRFYDILFIDTEGEIFHTIRKEKDYQANIFSGTLGKTALAEKMKARPSESLVDFQFYEISGEPSAFFIEPAVEDDVRVGWFVFQFAVNKINRIFSSNAQLGTTGEVFLVNEEHYMLTDSRFMPESAILRQQLSDENIHSKFQEEKGHKIVIDYRGFRVLSSFEVFSFLDCRWLIIAKITEAEILTDYYSAYRDCLVSKVDEVFASRQPGMLPYRPVKEHTIDVDMDEFRRIDGKQVLYTHGVSSCTAVLISYPGQFAYLAHISNYDAVYGGTKTDLLDQMIDRITYLEISQSEKLNLRFTVVSPKPTAWKGILDILLKRGFLLHQVSFFGNDTARYANLAYYLASDSKLIIWKLSDESFRSEDTENVPSFGEALRLVL